MTRRRVVALVAAVLSAFATTAMIPAQAENEHVFWLKGTSVVTNQCEYEWYDSNASTAGIQPQRDSLGIPRAKLYPTADLGGPAGPRCATTRNIPTVPLTDCKLARNLGEYPGIAANAPCMGQISATDNQGISGCASVGVTGVAECGLISPTWYYGYCGQTYGGAQGGTWTFGGSSYRIDRMGFTRGRGVWEFGGRMRKLVNNSPSGLSIQFRYYLAALPDKPNELVTCDVPSVAPISSVTFFGTAVVPATGPKNFRTEVGWHWCDDDYGPNGSTGAPFKAGTPGENC